MECMKFPRHSKLAHHSFPVLHCGYPTSNMYHLNQEIDQTYIHSKMVLPKSPISPLAPLTLPSQRSLLKSPQLLVVIKSDTNIGISILQILQFEMSQHHILGSKNGGSLVTLSYNEYLSAYMLNLNRCTAISTGIETISTFLTNDAHSLIHCFACLAKPKTATLNITLW
jgi:hypothetical protein